MVNHVSLEKIVEKFNLKNLTPKLDLSKKYVEVSDVNRPGVQFMGFFEHFPSRRIQVVGNVEYALLQQMEADKKKSTLKKFFSYHLPCVIFCRNLPPAEQFLKHANETDTPVFSTDMQTSEFMAEVIRWLNVELAPCVSVHGVLVDVSSVGVLIMGESGIGKSEAALELIKRGHRLVSDDVVEIRKVSDDTLVGSAPDITKHFIELRGIGIVDVRTLYGVSSVEDTQTIDLVITLEDWDKDRDYDRLGLEEQYTEFLGNRVACHRIPIRPGRNLAIIVETAAINFRQKAMGYNAAQELYNRVQRNMTRK